MNIYARIHKYQASLWCFAVQFDKVIKFFSRILSRIILTSVFESVIFDEIEYEGCDEEWPGMARCREPVVGVNRRGTPQSLSLPSRSLNRPFGPVGSPAYAALTHRGCLTSNKSKGCDEDGPATNFPESRGWCDPGKGLRRSHPFRAGGPKGESRVGAPRECCVSA